MQKISDIRVGSSVVLHSAKAVQENKLGNGSRAKFLGSKLNEATEKIEYHFKAEGDLRIRGKQIPKDTPFYFESPGLADEVVARSVSESQPAKNESQRGSGSVASSSSNQGTAKRTVARLSNAMLERISTGSATQLAPSSAVEGSGAKNLDEGRNSDAVERKTEKAINQQVS